MIVHVLFEEFRAKMQHVHSCGFAEMCLFLMSAWRISRHMCYLSLQKYLAQAAFWGKLVTPLCRMYAQVHYAMDDLILMSLAFSVFWHKTLHLC